MDQVVSGQDGELSGKPAKKARKQRSFWVELPFLVALALALAFLIKTFLAQAFVIPSGSMENTLQVGDRVLVNKLGHWTGSEITRGQVVVFQDPGGWVGGGSEESSNPVTRVFQRGLMLVGLMPSADQRFLIKRVIALPGDKVKCCDAKGRLTINGVPLEETAYLYPGNVPSEVQFERVVQPGRIWVMGDHRAVSFDSSKHLNEPFGGSIPADLVVGRAFTVVWHNGTPSWKPLSVPATFEQPALAGGTGS